MNLFIINTRWCFLIVDTHNHLMLCGGSKMGENSFKEFLFKFINRSITLNDGVGFEYLDELEQDTYIGDGIKVHIKSFDIILNVDGWNNKNYNRLSSNLFEYITTKLNLQGYKQVHLNKI